MLVPTLAQSLSWSQGGDSAGPTVVQTGFICCLARGSISENSDVLLISIGPSLTLTLLFRGKLKEREACLVLDNQYVKCWNPNLGLDPYLSPRRSSLEGGHHLWLHEAWYP